jgi:7-carboxy-7-deazaguanine synthase
MIRISEIFGPVIQGEGAHIGEPTVFIRVGGCDYRCTWCDSMYAVDPINRHDWKSMSNKEIVAEVERLTDENPLLVTLSGGNPALYDFEGVIDQLHPRGYRFTIETQGSVSQPWFRELDSMTLSPKPPSSNMPTDFRKLQECMCWLDAKKISLKIVVADDEDYAYARQIAARYPGFRCYLQVCNPAPSPQECDPMALLEKLDWLSNRILADRWFDATVLPQLHVLLYGNKRGV